jgi:hypothetical protein
MSSWMPALLLLAHLLGSIAWLGGMVFAHFAMRPAAHGRLHPRAFLCLIALLGFAAASRAAPPSDASIERLLTLTRAESTIDTMFSQIEHNIREGMKMAIQGRPLTAEQKKVLDLAPAKLAAAFRQEFSWPALKLQYLSIYREVFDQAEVDGMIAFYETPVGQATIAKMPQVVQRSMAASQGQLRTFLPRLEAAMKEALAEAGIRP